MDGSPDYSAADLEVLTLREAVVRRPAMYFGDYAAEDWPLVVAAWTATELLGHVAAREPVVVVSLHRDGQLSASVSGARLTWPVTAEPNSVEGLVRRRMWWRELASDLTVAAIRAGAPAGPAETVGEELVWDDLDIAVRLTLDAALIGVAPQKWWQDGIVRLRAVFDTDRFRLQPNQRLVVTAEVVD